jgi:hypothetical protein
LSCAGAGRVALPHQPPVGAQISGVRGSERNGQTSPFGLR